MTWSITFWTHCLSSQWVTPGYPCWRMAEWCWARITSPWLQTCPLVTSVVRKVPSRYSSLTSGCLAGGISAPSAFVFFVFSGALSFNHCCPDFCCLLTCFREVRHDTVWYPDYILFKYSTQVLKSSGWMEASLYSRCPPTLCPQSTLRFVGLLSVMFTLWSCKIQHCLINTGFLVSLRINICTTSLITARAAWRHTRRREETWSNT